MSDTVIVALISAGSALLGAIIGLIGNRVIEFVRAKNERRIFISKARFDKEFLIYQELSEKNLDSVYCAGKTVQIVNCSEVFSDNEKKDHLERFCSLLSEAEFANKKYAPFISSDIFSAYAKLEKRINHIYRMYVNWYSFEEPYNLNGEEITKDILTKRITDEQKEISNLSDQILDGIRKYLSSLDVLEERERRK